MINLGYVALLRREALCYIYYSRGFTLSGRPHRICSRWSRASVTKSDVLGRRATRRQLGIAAV